MLCFSQIVKLACVACARREGGNMRWSVNLHNLLGRDDCKGIVAQVGGRVRGKDGDGFEMREQLF